MVCYQLEAVEIKNEKQWLANIKTISSERKTATPATYVASNQRHQQCLEEEANTGKKGKKDKEKNEKRK